MAHIHRLIFALVGLLLASSAHAFSPSTLYSINAPQYGGDTGLQPSAQAACNVVAARASASAGITLDGVLVSGGAHCEVWPPNRFSIYGSWAVIPTLACPANSSGGAECTCNPGYQENSDHTSCLPEPPPPCPDGQTRVNGICVPADCPPDTTRVNGICVPDPDCPPGYTRVNGQCVKNRCPAGGSSAGEYVGTSTGTAYTCEPYANTLCGVKVEMDFCVVNGAVRSCQGQGEWTGSGCTAGNGNNPPDPDPDPGPNPPTDPPTDPPPESGDPSPPKPVDPTKPPLPTPQPQPENPDGSCPAGTSKVNGACIKNPEPPNSDGQCPAGSVKVGTECVYSSPAPAPGGPIIGDPGPGDPDPGTGSGGGTFAGSCETGFLCEGGDAIHCAIAKEQHVRNCRLYDAQGNAKAVLYYAEDGKQGNQTGDLPGNDTVNVGPGNFDTTNVLGAAFGVSDLTVTVAGSSVTLPMSKVNPMLEMLGNLLLSISFLLAARIAARG